jgi:PAS domain S-box-containing protein
MLSDIGDHEGGLQAAVDLCEEIDALNEQAWSLKDSDPERSRVLCEQVQHLVSEDIPCEDGLAYSRLLLSVLEWDRSNYRAALSLAFEAQALFKKTGNLSQQAATLSHLAGIHFFLGEYRHALTLAFAAIQLSEDCGDRGRQADLLNDIGYFYAHMGRFSEALSQLLRSLKMHRELGSKQGEANVLHSLGKTYYLMGDYPLALSHEFQSLEIDRSIGYKRTETEALSNIGRIYAASNDPAQARAYFEQALVLARARGYKQFETAILLDMSKIHLSEQKTELAHQCLVSALEIAESIHSRPVMFEVHQAFADFYEQRGDSRKALAHYKQFHQIKEAVFDEKSDTVLSSKQAVLEAQKQLEDLVEERTRQVEREKRYFESVVSNSPVAIIVIDLNSNVVSWNPAAETLFGYTQAEVVGHNIDDLITTEAMRPEAADYSRQAIEEETLIHVVTQRLRKDGTLVDVEVLGVPVIVEGQQVGGLAIYHDITELQRARYEAETANQAKSTFLAVMSHEIRTPMNGIIGMTSLLLDTALSPEQRDYAETIRNSGEALLTIINDILDFSKIEAGKMELENQPFDLRECVESALDLVVTKAHEKRLELAYLIDSQVPAMLMGDVTRLRQILLNLLSNAIKFTGEGEVTVVVNAERETTPLHPTLHFSVHDTGIGIPPDRMDRLFQSFSQVDASTTRKHGGTGLGLAISKRLSEMMGGTMWVESEVGKGSTFHFTIQAEAAPVQARIYLRSEQPQLRDRRVLIVDDNETNRRVLVAQTRAWNMLPRETASPHEAIEWIRRGDRFDIALLDMQMPEMDGMTLATEMRHYWDAQTLPIVLLSSLDRRETGAEVAQFAAYLNKPIKQSALYNTLLRVFAEHPSKTPERESPEGLQFDVHMAERLPLRILVAEDNAINQKLALQMLRKMGYRADLAGDGTEVLQALERQPYDVILMDVQMPEMDGLEVTRRICQTWTPENRPHIIAMTANAMLGDREACLAAGMDDYISKPVRGEELQNALERWGQRESAPPALLPTQDSAPPTIDWAVLDRLRALQEEGEPDFVRETIDLYLADASSLIEALRQAVVLGDAARLQHAAHTLKGNSNSLGAKQMAAVSLELEKIGRSGTIETAKSLLVELEREYERVRQAFQSS